MFTRLVISGIGLLAGIAGLGLLVQCSPAAPRAEVTIRWWNPFSGPDGGYALRLVRAFQEQHPEVRVLMQRMDAGTYYNKLFVAGLGERAPEVFVVHSDVLPRFERAGLLRPIDDLIAESGFDPSDIDEPVWRMVRFDGRTVALPLDAHPIAMYYNKRLLREAGIVDGRGEAKPPRTREEFVEVLRRTRQGDRWGFVFTWFRTNLYSIMSQFGGRMFDEDRTRCTLESEANAEALRFCVELIDRGLIPPPQGSDAWIGFRQGKVALAWEGPWMLRDLEELRDLEYGVAPLPVLGEEAAVWCNSHNLCLRPGMEDAERGAAWKFVRFLSDHSTDWAEAGQVPVRQSLRESDRFERMWPQTVFASQLPDVRYMPRIPYVFEFLTEFDIAVERALRGTVEPREALAAATERIEAAMARDREVHEAYEAAADTAPRSR